MSQEYIRRITKSPTTENRQPTSSLPTQRPLIHYQVNHRKQNTNSPIGPLPTHQPLTTNSLTHRTYYNRQPTLGLTKLILTKSPLDQFLH